MNWDSETKLNSIIKKTGKQHLYSYLYIKLLKISNVVCWVWFGKGSNYSLKYVWGLILKMSMQLWEPAGTHAVFVSEVCCVKWNASVLTSPERECLLITRSLKIKECLVSVSSLLLNYLLTLSDFYKLRNLSQAYLVIAFLDS